MSKKNIDKLLPKIEGYPLIGWIIHWAIPDFQMSYTTFSEILKNIGIPDNIAKVVSSKEAAIRSMRDTLADMVEKLNSNGGRKKRRADLFYKKIKDGSDEDEASWMIVDADVNDIETDIDFRKETRVIFNKKTHELRIEGDNADKYRKEILNRYNTYRDCYTGTQLRSSVLKYIRMYGRSINVRSAGGIYFLPYSSSEVYENVLKLFEELSVHGVDITPIPLIDTKEAKKGMWKSLVAEIKYDIEVYNKEIDEAGELKEYVVENKLKKFDELKTKVEMYETVLSGTAEDLKKSLAKMKTKLKKKLME